MITWEQITEAEPRLLDLLKEAQGVKDKGGSYFCANDIWYRGNKEHASFKQRLFPLVGDEASKSLPGFMRTSKAWDIAYRKVYDVLPPCRNCICF